MSCTPSIFKLEGQSVGAYFLLEAFLGLTAGKSHDGLSAHEAEKFSQEFEDMASSDGNHCRAIWWPISPNNTQLRRCEEFFVLAFLQPRSAHPYYSSHRGRSSTRMHRPTSVFS